MHIYPLKRFAPLLAAGLLVLAAEPAPAQDGYDSSTGVQGTCRSNCDVGSGSSGGGTYSTPPVYVPSWAEIARIQAVEINRQGVEAQERGDLREAIRLYELAFRRSPDATIKSNLGVACNNLGAKLSREGDWEGALYWYKLGQQYHSSRVNTDNIAKAQAAIENEARQAEQQRAAEIAAAEQQRAAEIAAAEELRAAAEKKRAAEIAAQEAARKEAQRQADLAADQERTSKLVANLRDDLARQASDTNAASTSSGLDFIAANGALAKAESDAGLVFMNGTETQAKSTSAQEPTDTSVVDARGPIGSLPLGLPRLEEVENSPGREAWLRGMDAAANSDWELAAAWFGTAQLRDPTNEVLGRAVALAQWTRNHKSGGPTGTGTPSKTAGSASGSALQVPQDSDLEFLLDDNYRRENVVAPNDSDLEFLFDPNAGPGGDAPATDAELMFLGGPVGFTRDSTLPPGAPLADRLRMARQNFAAEMIHWGQLREVRGGPSESALSLMELGARQAPEIPEFAEMRDAMRQRLERSRQIQPDAGNLGLAPVMPLERW